MTILFKIEIMTKWVAICKETFSFPLRERERERVSGNGISHPTFWPFKVGKQIRRSKIQYGVCTCDNKEEIFWILSLWCFMWYKVKLLFTLKKKKKEDKLLLRLWFHIFQTWAIWFGLSRSSQKSESLQSLTLNS